MSKIEVPSNPTAAAAMTALLEANTRGAALQKGLHATEKTLGRRLSREESNGLDTLLTGLEVQDRIAPQDLQRLRGWIQREHRLRRDYEQKLATQGLNVAAKASLIGGLIGLACFFGAAPDAVVSFNVDTVFAAAVTLSTMVGVAGIAVERVVNASTTYGLNPFEEKLEPRIAELERDLP
ncbi:MAG: hypothetical protein U1E65_26205 [Myxococcota bacterium]